jgi:hypothetical protein
MTLTCLLCEKPETFDEKDVVLSSIGLATYPESKTGHKQINPIALTVREEGKLYVCVPCLAKTPWKEVVDKYRKAKNA